jgi:hypothetical protein
MEKLPLYNLVITDNEEGEEEVDFVALVESPAIQKNFLAFKEEEVKGKTQNFVYSDYKFAVQNEEQKIVTGPLMIADLPIYRRDEEDEYYVMFSAEEIMKIVQRFFKKGYQGKVNVEHSTPIDGVFMYESYIIDREKGVMPPKGFEDVSDGSWFGTFKVENERIWSLVKNGTFKGFSVEGIFKYEKTNETITEEEIMMSKIINILKKIEQ